MKLFVTQVATTEHGTSMTTVSEWTDNPDGAIMAYHAQARALRGDAETKKYTIKILDEQMNQYGEYCEFFARPEEPEPEPEEA